MVERIWTPRDKQYKFAFCKNCEFYECELVGEYSQFRENHAEDQDQKSLGNVTLADGRCVGRVISIRSIEEDEEYDDIVSESGSADEHSHLFDADAVSYDPKLKHDCFMSYRHVYQVECGRKKVTEGIGDHYKIEIADYNYKIKRGITDRWEPSQPVFISAQTGQGKNFFIEKTLIPYVRKLNLEHQTKQKVLILSNRRALKTQIKDRLDGNDNSDKEKEKYFYDENTDVMTYQGLLLYKEKLEVKQKYAKSRYIFVICDEAHFFTSDAMFNPHTQKILQAIIQVFKSAVRIYMSATPYECLEYITTCEEKELSRLNHLKYGDDQSKYEYGKMVFYHFKRDYSYLDVKAYSKIKELYEEIIESVNKRKEKWLIFIDDKKKGINVKEQLEKRAEAMNSPLVVKKGKKKDDEDDRDNKSKKTVEKVYVINAKSKMELTYQKIVKNEKLNKDTYVLISTSVLDNGVNLKGIKNIVVSDMTKAKCLQMVGRARVEGDNGRKNLYIKRFSDGEVEKRKADLKKQQDAYGKYKIAYNECGQRNLSGDTYEFFKKYYCGSEKDWRNAKRWFGRTIETELYLNKIAESLLEGLLLYYQSIYDEMVDEKAKEDNAQGLKCISHIGQKYLEYQLSWFGKKYCEDDDITFADREKAKKEFIDFLESYAKSGEHIEDRGKESPFRKKFTELSDAAFGRWGRHPESYYHIDVMNKRLKKEKIDYKICSHENSKYWKVERYNCEMEDSK